MWRYVVIFPVMHHFSSPRQILVSDSQNQIVRPSFCTHRFALIFKSHTGRNPSQQRQNISILIPLTAASIDQKPMQPPFQLHFDETLFISCIFWTRKMVSYAFPAALLLLNMHAAERRCNLQLLATSLGTSSELYWKIFCEIDEKAWG